MIKCKVNVCKVKQLTFLPYKRCNEKFNEIHLKTWMQCLKKKKKNMPKKNMLWYLWTCIIQNLGEGKSLAGKFLREKQFYFQMKTLEWKYL